MSTAAGSPVRVAVWSTGAIGKLAIERVVGRDDMDLVAVWVHSPEKVGRDVGEFIGGDVVGVTTSATLDDVLAARPDIVVYTASGPELDAVNMPVYLALLRAGVDVITVSSPWLMYPPAADAALIDELTAAATAGESTLYASGLEPGFVGDHLVALLSTMSATVNSVRTQEIFDYDTYENSFLMCDVFGFGKPLDETPIMQLGGVQTMTWGPPVQYAAAALGLKLDCIRETYERRETPRALDVASGRIAAGTCGAIRMETIGVVNGRDAIVIEHINRMAPDLAPDWPSAARDGTYRVIIDGEPGMICELTFGDEESAGDHGMLATAMRLVNAIPYVRVCEGGRLVSSMDLPITSPSGPRSGVPHALS
ncbi:MAG: dihydrodipicolinate reductase [Actinomycetota bacterium]